jgi:hypothetical protein
MDTQNVENWDELRDLVTEKGGVLTVSMATLRDIHGAGKLGIWVREHIQEKLKGVGLGHYPPELPQYQENSVRLYRLGTPLADLIKAVLEPGETNDARLLKMTDSDASEVLKKIRELVCE